MKSVSRPVWIVEGKFAIGHLYVFKFFFYTSNVNFNATEEKKKRQQQFNEFDIISQAAVDSSVKAIFTHEY